MSRTPLPNRRRAATLDVAGDQPFTVTVGFDDCGAAKEVFADGGKYGSGLSAIVDDACTVISVALQHGVPPRDLAKSLGAVPAAFGHNGSRAASPIGLILEVLIAEVDFVEALKCVQK